MKRAVFHMSLWVVLVGCQGAMAMPRPFPDEIDPFNTYQWNRDNRESQDIDTGDWYEWWYYKLIDPRTNDKFLFCYGVVNPWDTAGESDHSRAFVMFGDFGRNLILEKEYPVSAFEASYDRPYARVGPHQATDRSLVGDFEQDGHSVTWALTLNKRVGWDAMGWGLLFPQIFNIYWHPAQIDATYNGFLTVDGHTYFIVDADGYQDRNWGRRFPQWWFWMAINSFDENPDSAFVGGGGDARTRDDLRLPTAILLGLWHNGHLYEFRTSDFQHFFRWQLELGQWNIRAVNQNYRLQVTASADPREMMDLEFRTPNGQIFHDYETLGGAAHIELYERQPSLRWEKIADLSTQNAAGLEFGLDHQNTVIPAHDTVIPAEAGIQTSEPGFLLSQE